MRTYDVWGGLERIALKEDAAVFVLCGGRVGDGDGRLLRSAWCGVLLRGGFDGCEGEAFGLRGGGLHAEQFLGPVTRLRGVVYDILDAVFEDIPGLFVRTGLVSNCDLCDVPELWERSVERA